MKNSSWNSFMGSDMDQQHNPFQCNLGYQVSLSGKGEWNKKADYVGKAVLEKMGADIKAGKTINFN